MFFIRWRYGGDMREIQLPYGQGENGGKGFSSLKVPQNIVRYSFREPVPAVQEHEFRLELRNLLVSELESAAQEEQAGNTVAIVVADKTRLCGYTTILPWVVETLHELHIKATEITFFIAYGTHPRQSDAECLEAYGEVYNNYRFIHHECGRPEQFRELGRTSRGTPVRIRNELCAARKILTIGAVSHHYFAGYGGGRKLIFPGLGEREAIYANHGLFLDSKRSSLAPGCRPGNLTENPLADDLYEVHSMMPDYLSIHGILDSHGEVARFVFGRNYADFLKACEELDSYYTVEQKEQHELVVASAGGFPKDINFIQSHKSIHNAAPLVKDGGTLIMFAQCPDGIGSKTFLPYFRMGGWKQAFAELVQNYVGNGGTALAMMAKTKRIRIAMVTELDEAICREIGVQKLTVEQANELVEKSSPETCVGVIANASLLVSKPRAAASAGNEAAQS